MMESRSPAPIPTRWAADYRSGVHFNPKGLEAHGKLWREKDQALSGQGAFSSVDTQILACRRLRLRERRHMHNEGPCASAAIGRHVPASYGDDSWIAIPHSGHRFGLARRS